MSEPATSSAVSDSTEAEMIISAEEFTVATVRVPYRRVRIAKRVVTETRTVTVDVQREKLIVEDVPLTDADLSPAAFASSPESSFEITLSEEQVVIDRRIVPVERVRVTVETLSSLVDVHADLAAEHVRVDETG